MKIAFTNQSLRALPIPPPEGPPQVVYWDTKTPGLGYVLGRTGIGMFIANYYRDGARRRESLGRLDELSLPEARKACAAVLGRVAEDKTTPGDVRKAAKNGPTVDEMFADYIVYLKNSGCRPRTLETYEREMTSRKTSHVKTWLDRPAQSILGRECKEKHDYISREFGPHVANRVMRQFRAAWNRRNIVLVAEGGQAVPLPTLAVAWHAGEHEGFVERRREPITWDALPKWREDIGKLLPVRRDYNLIVLLTALRRNDAATLREEYLNLTELPITTRVWNLAKRCYEPKNLLPFSMLRPNPKGGPDRAFTVPLSMPAVEIFRARIEGNRAMNGSSNGWIFPALAMKNKYCSMCHELGLGEHQRGQVIHVAEPQEKKKKLSSPHRLRDTYVTGGDEAGIPDNIIKILINHRWGNRDVTDGYRKQDFDYLRRAQATISEFLLEKMQRKTETAPAPQRSDAEAAAIA